MKLKLKKSLWEIFKAGAIMATVGVALALAAPLIAMAIPGVLDASVSTYADAAKALAPGVSPLWTGSFFGAFGALNAAIAPVENWLFGKAEAKINGKAAAKELVVEKAPVIVVVTQKEADQGKAGSKFREALAAKRDAEQLTQR